MWYLLGFVIGTAIFFSYIGAYMLGVRSAYCHMRKNSLLEDTLIRRHEGLPPRKKPKGKK